MVDYVAPMDALVSNSVARPRLYAVLLGIFAAVALALATIGIYAVVSYAVTQRTREIGVRIALGGTSAQVARLVLQQSVVLIAAGVVTGLGGRSRAHPVPRSMALRTDRVRSPPIPYTAVAIGFGIVATAATFIPTRRAIRVNPFLVALRAE